MTCICCCLACLTATGDKKPTKPSLKRSESFNVAYQDITPRNVKGHISHLYLSTTGDIWASNDRGKLGLIDRYGKNIRSLETCSTYTGHFVPVAVDGQKDERIYWVHNEKKFVKIDGKKKSEGTFEWVPISIFYSAEEMMFYVGKVRENDAKITRYNKDLYIQDDIHKHIVNETNANLFKYPAYLAKKPNGDLCVSDNNQYVMVVKDKTLRFRYPRFDQGGFTPYGICTDSGGQIFVVDSSSRSIHIVNQEGTLERQIKMLDYLREPRGLCIDKNGNCYVGTFGTILVYKPQDQKKNETYTKP